MCTKLILAVSKYYSTSECVQTLQWLPIHERVDYKILTRIYKCTRGQAPMHLQDLLVNAVPRREGLCSSSIMYTLVVPCVQRQTFAARSFVVYGPSLWNSIPDGIKRSPTLESFRSRVKTLLYKQVFNT